MPASKQEALDKFIASEEGQKTLGDFRRLVEILEADRAADRNAATLLRHHVHTIGPWPSVEALRLELMAIREADDRACMFDWHAQQVREAWERRNEIETLERRLKGLMG